MITKIAVTGTKGKTTVVNFLAEVLQRAQLFDEVLHVNTSGHFLNGKRKSDLTYSSQTWGLVPSVAPGRYLYEFASPKKQAKNNLAVLECSLGSSTLSGMGYALHDVGVFLNVYEDHIGSSHRIKSKDDILAAKLFSVTKIKKGGYAVLNADDEYVRKAYPHINQKEKGVQVILFGLHITPALLKKYPCAAYVTVQDGQVVYVSGETGKVTKVVALKKVAWTFAGHFTPSVYNLMAIVAAAYGVTNLKGVSRLGTHLAATQMPEDGGRLTQFANKAGVKIIADYAHEKYSLREVARLARLHAGKNGKVIGVVRLAYDRTDALIKDTAAYIGKDYDQFFVYDKIDGYWKKAKEIQSTIFTQEDGKISRIFAEALAQKNKHVTRIVREDEAIAAAAETAKKGDVVIVIVNDNIPRSISFIKKYFKAVRS